MQTQGRYALQRSTRFLETPSWSRDPTRPSDTSQLAGRCVHAMDPTSTKNQGALVTGGVVLCVALYLSVYTAVARADFMCVCVLYMW